MRVEIDLTKSATQNMTLLYEKAKKLKEKEKRVEEEIEKTKELIKNRKIQINKKQDAKRIRKKEWYEKFRFSFTSKHKLMIAGRSAKENDLLVKRYFEENDLFFHADIHGAAVVILKKGKEADDKELEECAQFAACYSNAWKSRLATIDVYALEKEQVLKGDSDTFVPTGSFVLKGRRRWFRNIELALIITKEQDKAMVFPAKINKKGIVIKPGKEEKNKIAKKIAKMLSIDEQELFPLIPGPSQIVAVKK